jgi:hypothetical protein
MDEFTVYIIAFIVGWFAIGAASAFIIAATFFGFKETDECNVIRRKDKENQDVV